MNTQHKKLYSLITTLALSMAVLAPLAAMASDAKSDATLTLLITRADKEIDLRIASLQTLTVRMGEMKKLTQDQLNSLGASVQAEITQLTTLKAKIDADTDLATAKTDLQSITKSYRIYLLVLPKTRIMAAADRIISITDILTSVEVKIQARISALPAGTDTSGMQQTLTDVTAKITDAKNLANAAIQEVSGLKPDNGDTATMQANMTALKDAKSKIMAARADLIAARKEIGTLVLDIKGKGESDANQENNAQGQNQQ